MGAAHRLDAEDLREPDIVENFGGRSVGDPQTVIEQQQPVAKAGRERQIMQHDDHAGALTADSAHQLQGVELMLRIETGQRLVREEIRRLHRQRPRQQDAAALAARERPDRAAGEAGNIAKRQRPRDRLPVGITGLGEGATMRQATEPDQGLD